MGVPILQSQFTNLALYVEAAFGAAPGSNGPWTDITSDVRADPITITAGRADEASTTQPATCTFAVNNGSGRWTLGPQSPNQGLAHNIPIRVRAVLNGTSYVRFWGELALLTPGWDETGQVAIATISAAGPLRRLGTTSQPIVSAMRHYALAQPALAAYWPCEDGPKATSFASATGGMAMTSSTGLPKPASYTGFVASAAAPVLGAESYTAMGFGSVNTLVGGQIWLMVYIPVATLADQTRIATINVACPALTRIDLIYNTANSGSVSFKGYQNATLVCTGAAAPPPGGADGQNVLLGFDWNIPVTGTVNLDLEVCGLDVGGVNSTGTTVSTSYIAGVNSVVIAPDAACAGMAIAHLYLQTTALGGTFTVPQAASGFIGEDPATRVARIATEQGEPLAVTGVSGVAMGVQPQTTYLAVLRDAETADLGILFDGAAAGLSYTSRDSRENQEPTLVLDAAAREIVALPPVFDDQQLVNSFTASRTGGSAYTYSDTTSKEAVAAIGEHPGSQTVNVASDSQLPDYAGYKVGLGTVPGYRYPSMVLNPAGAPRILAGWLATPVSGRLDAKNISKIRTVDDPRDPSLIVEGWTEAIDQFNWTVAVNCTSYDPWRTGVLANDTGDTGEFLGRLDPDGSTTTGGPAGSLSLSVSTPSGPLWITGSGDDFTMDLDVGGLRVTCTAISGSSSPQTFTVTATSLPIPSGSTVAAWRNPALGM